MSAGEPVATRISAGVYLVEYEGRHETVYVAGPAGDRWAFWNGRVFRSRQGEPKSPGTGSSRREVAQTLTSPMPATVLKVLVEPGSRVKKGDTVLVLEAMKMELPIRADRDSVVAAVHCRKGELVQPEMVLVELS